MAFDPTSTYSTFVDAEGEVYISQGGVWYDRSGNAWTALPKSKKNGYAAGNGFSASQVSLVQSSVSGGLSSSSALPRWKTALAKARAGTAGAKLCVISDSTSVGPFADSTTAYGLGQMAHCWPYILASYLSSVGYSVNTDSVFGDVTGTTTPATLTSHDPRRTLGANWVYNAAWTGLGGQVPTNSTAGSQTSYSFTPAAPFDTIEICYVQNVGYGSWTVNVDGGAQLGATVVNNGTLTLMQTTRTCALGMHTVNIQRSAPTGADGSLPILHIRTYDSTKPGTVHVLNAGGGGLKTADYSNNTAVFRPIPHLKLLAPDLTIISLDINDWIGGAVTPGTYDLSTTTTHAFQLLQIVTAAKISGDAIIMVAPPASLATDTQAVQDAITQASRQIATITGCPVVDLGALWGSWNAAVAAGYYSPANDPRHPGYAGYQNIASQFSWIV